MPSRQNPSSVEKRIREFERLSDDFRLLGGDPEFLRYAWGTSLAEVAPGLVITRLPPRWPSALMGKRQLRGLLRKTQVLVASLENIRRPIRRQPLYSDTVGILQQLESDLRLKLGEATLRAKRSRRRAGRKTEFPRRYVLYSALWPYAESLNTEKRSAWWEWMGEFFRLDDATNPENNGFARSALSERGGQEFSEINTENFDIRPASKGTPEVHYWWIHARRTVQPDAQAHIQGGVNAFLEWNRFRARVGRLDGRPTPTERRYVEVAWPFLRDECGVTEIDDVGGRLGEWVKTLVSGHTRRERREALDRALNTLIGRPSDPGGAGNRP